MKKSMENRGRKPLPPGEARGEQIKISVNAREKEVAYRNSALTGWSLQDLVRAILVKGDLSAIDAILRVTHG